ncbi:hypothetical protein EDE12_103106 [Methylosinus sp. sav-2]|uniref:hypothetical protein n=1 Tax=Methylosinus sp. sav-2 TaxID=2485168 RepID=UPI00047E7C9F|nr:hypothetical protein [Methylosinus sp. sav-2]TDX65134.1 hypothetical protein EDE12_103106 [Methylosinus sp. sav-2]
MTYIGVLVDDQESVYAETLSSGALHFDAIDMTELTLLARKIIDKNPMIVALDYRLDEAPDGLNSEQTFKGSALGQHLRDIAVERPSRDFALVLVSAETKIKSLYRPDKTAHDLFDRVYVKEDINNYRERTRKQLVSLCKGYEKLRAADGYYDLHQLLDGIENDRPFIDVQELRTKVSEAKAPHVISRIVFGLIDRPGLLIEIEDVCAHLGIDIRHQDTIAKFLDTAGIRYTGIFGDGWKRWWLNRLEDWATTHFGRRATGLPASARAKILSDLTGECLEPARSPWNNSGEEFIAFACACCRRGTELRHSVAAFEPMLPRYATRRRICWDCIQTDRHESGDISFIVEDVDKELANKVKTRERSE